jgi:hypothetical protein
MSRLNSEWQRLYGPAGVAAHDGSLPALLDEWQGTRALLIELVCPVAWAEVARLGVAIQSELALPAPALAVNGRDAYQVWFSLAQSVPLPQAIAFLTGLQQRYLAGVPANKVRLWPAAEGSLAEQPTLPPFQASSGDWAAFVAPDLAPMFADTPWLDIPPRLDGQAELLARLGSIPPDDFARVLGVVTRPDRPASTSSDARQEQAGGRGGRASVPHDLAEPGAAADQSDPYAHVAGDPIQFLQAVMADAQAPLALRIEAAKALLPARR